MALTEEQAVQKLKEMRQPQGGAKETPKASPKESLLSQEESHEEDVQSVSTNETQEEVTEEVTNEVTNETTDFKSGEPEPAQSDAEEVELDAEQIAGMLGLEPDNLIVSEDGKVKVRAKVDGKISEPTLQDVIRSYQTEEYLSQKGREVAKLKEQREKEFAEFISRTQGYAQQQAELLETLKGMYINPATEEELSVLRQTDPAEYAARKEEMREKEQQLSRIANEAARKMEEARKLQMEEVQRNYQSFLEDQRKVLYKNIPTFDKEKESIISYARHSGFDDSEINSIADARILTLMHKAMLYDKGASRVKEKLSKPLAKVIKPGARKNLSDIALEDVAKKRANLKKTGSVDDAVALLRSMRGK